MTTWNEAKRRDNLRKHRVDLVLAEQFEWSTASIVEDVGKDYGERREVATGFIGLTLYVFVYTLRAEEDHAISLRKANKQDSRRYAQDT
ncbi:MAG: BrnT family toxin [Rhizobiales bacterium]|nr:BrnT family toxin [Hyphomicrobiales bacterium]